MRSVLIGLALLFPLFQADIVSAQGNAEAGKKLWESVDARCRDCHGLRGQGAFGLLMSLNMLIETPGADG